MRLKRWLEWAILFCYFLLGGLFGHTLLGAEPPADWPTSVAIASAQMFNPWPSANACPPGAVCPTCPDQGQSATPHPAICMVFSDGARAPHTGSLVYADDTIGLVLSVAHGHQQPDAEIVVKFSDGRRYAGSLVGVDHNDDLAAIRIAAPEGISPLTVATTHPARDARVWYAGYGQPGGYRRFDTTVDGYTAMEPYNGRDGSRSRSQNTIRAVTLIVRLAARNMDSGSPIVNRENEIVAVLSCTDVGRRETLGTYCGVIRTFLGRVLAKLRPDHSVAEAPPSPIQPVVDVLQNTDRLDAIEARLDELIVAIAAIPAGRQGSPGEVGAVGPQGSPGPAGPVGPQGEPGQAAMANMDVLTKQVLERLLGTDDEPGLLPGITFQPIDGYGEPISDPKTVWLGDTLNMHSFRVEKPQ